MAAWTFKHAYLACIIISSPGLGRYVAGQIAAGKAEAVIKAITKGHLGKDKWPSDSGQHSEVHNLPARKMNWSDIDNFDWELTLEEISSVRLLHESPAIQVSRWWWMSIPRSPPLLVLFRFYARDSGLLKFEIQAGLLGRPINHTVRRLVAFTFHPFEPFAISVQRTNAEYVVNFHMRHCCT